MIKLSCFKKSPKYLNIIMTQLLSKDNIKTYLLSIAKKIHPAFLPHFEIIILKITSSIFRKSLIFQYF